MASKTLQVLVCSVFKTTSSITTMTKEKKNSKGTKAIFLDAKDNTLSYVYIKHYTDIYKHCQFGTFTTVNIAKGDVMFVDDEGLINGTDFGFDIDSYPAPIMGNAIIMSTNKRTGDSANVKHTLNQIAKITKSFLVKDNVIVQHKFSQQILK